MRCPILIFMQHQYPGIVSECVLIRLPLIGKVWKGTVPTFYCRLEQESGRAVSLFFWSLLILLTTSSVVVVAFFWSDPKLIAKSDKIGLSLLMSNISNIYDITIRITVRSLWLYSRWFLGSEIRIICAIFHCSEKQTALKIASNN